LNILVGHVRIREELVQALRRVAPVALYDGNGQALLDGVHGVPYRYQERVDAGRVVFQLEAEATLEEAALFVEPLRKRPPEAGATVVAP
jgi:uncharacterized SAM-dependent methyltransferase